MNEFSRRALLASTATVAGVGLISASATAQEAMSGENGKKRIEAQPHMQQALKHLRAAQEQLKFATKDKGGHRVRALALTDKAMAEVERGIAYDIKNK